MDVHHLKKTHKYVFLQSFHNSTEYVACTEYFSMHY
jgi:hypothetical protein